MRRLEFWYDLASNYSYLSAMRITALAEHAGVEVAWRPFLLGPIFKARGWTSSPFNLFPDKGRNMVRDMQRICEERGLAFELPAPFPANSLLAVRIAHGGEAEGWTPAFTRSVFMAEFGTAANIADPQVLGRILGDIGLDAAAVIADTGTDTARESLRARTADAQARGIYGAPSFVTEDGELFWGDDRLEQAMRWAVRHP